MTLHDSSIGQNLTLARVSTLESEDGSLVPGSEVLSSVCPTGRNTYDPIPFPSMPVDNALTVSAGQGKIVYAAHP